MKKTFSFFLLFSLLYLASASSVASPVDFINPYTEPTDTVPYIFNEEELPSCNDTLALSPAFDLYENWDTENIHFRKCNIDSLREISKKITLCDNSSCGYVHPFQGKVTCPFGAHRRYYHCGVDIDLETGDKVMAAFDGKVRIAKKSSSYGNIVVIRHSNGLETYYAHLSKIKVEVGQEIFAGDIVGLGGNTGNSRGSHLHFEVRYLGQAINPADIISFTDDKLISDTLQINKQTFSYLAKGKKATNSTANAGKLLAGNVYVIKSGDSLSAIARKYGTSIDLICKKNKLSKTTILQLGQKIKI